MSARSRTADAPTATWEVASVEPGLDLAAGRARRVDADRRRDARPASVPWGRYSFPFVFRATGPSLGSGAGGGRGVRRRAAGRRHPDALSVVPREPGLTVTFVLPAGMVPARSSLPGVVRLGRWTATFVAVPAEGIAWRSQLPRRRAERRCRTSRIAVTSARFPGGTGWQGLPAWLPQDTAVWSANATWVLPPQLGPRDCAGAAVTVGS